MKKDYYMLHLNNARYMTFDNEIYNGCLKVSPEYEINGEIKNFDGPFFVIAEKGVDGFVDIISGKLIKFDDSFVSHGNFELSEENDKYLDTLSNIDEEVLSKYDEEAGHILNYYRNDLSCYDYRVLSGVEVVNVIKELDNPEVVSKYMRELRSIEFGEIAKEKATLYLDYRKRMLGKKNLDTNEDAEKYIRVFKSRYKKLNK